MNRGKGKRVFIGCISRNRGDWGMLNSLLANINNLSVHGYNVTFHPLVGDSLVSRARNELQAYFLLYSNADYFFQMDDDIGLPPNGIKTLIEADKDVIGGVYRLKSDFDDYKCALRAYAPFSLKDHPNEVVKLQYLSTGCFLQKRHVCEKMEENYPELKYLANSEKDNPERYALYQPYIYDVEYLSEDWAYCQRLLDSGFEIYAHTGVLCDHWGIKNYNFRE